MSFVLTTPPAPYTGGYLPKPIALGRPLASGESPNSINVVIDWNVAPYNRGAVSLNFQVQASSNPIQNIRSILIDNSIATNSSGPVSQGTSVAIVFPDTQQTIIVAAGAIEVHPVQSSSLEFIVYALSIVQTATPVNVSTKILASNVYIEADQVSTILGGTDTSVVAYGIITADNGTNRYGPLPIGKNLTSTEIDLSVNNVAAQVAPVAGILNNQTIFVKRMSAWTRKLWSPTLALCGDRTVTLGYTGGAAIQAFTFYTGVGRDTYEPKMIFDASNFIIPGNGANLEIRTGASASRPFGRFRLDLSLSTWLGPNT